MIPTCDGVTSTSRLLELFHIVMGLNKSHWSVPSLLHSNHHAYTHSEFHILTDVWEVLLASLVDHSWYWIIATQPRLVHYVDFTVKANVLCCEALFILADHCRSPFYSCPWELHYTTSRAGSSRMVLHACVLRSYCVHIFTRCILSLNGVRLTSFVRKSASIFCIESLTTLAWPLLTV